MTGDNTGGPSASAAEEPIPIDATQCTMLGLDGEGYHHVLVPDYSRIVVLNAAGIDKVQPMAGRSITAWMQFVAEVRGWQRRQYIQLDATVLDCLGGA